MKDMKQKWRTWRRKAAWTIAVINIDRNNVRSGRGQRSMETSALSPNKQVKAASEKVMKLK